MNSVDRVVMKFRSATRVGTRSLAIYRILFGLWMLLMFRSLTWIADAPPTFFDPPLLSLANLFNHFPARGFFIALNVLTVALSLMLLLGWRTRAAGLALALVKVVGSSFAFSFGKVDHSILPVCALIALSFSSWGDAYSLDGRLLKKTGRKHREGSDLALLGVFISFGFFSAGFGKALHWLDFNVNTGGFLSWLLTGYYLSNRTLLLAGWAVHMPWPWLWEIIDVSAVVFELGFFWALLNRRRWLTWIMILCGFHLANTLLLNIPFLPDAIVAMAFVPWATLFRPVGKWAWLSGLGLSAGLVGMVIVLSARRLPAHLITDGFRMPMKELVLIGQACVWAGLFFIFLRACLQSLQMRSPASFPPMLNRKMFP